MRHAPSPVLPRFAGFCVRVSLLWLAMVLTLGGTPFGETAHAVTAAVDQDSWLKEAAPTDNFGDDKELPIKNKPTDNERAVFRFDLSAIPPTSEISTATATFRVTTPDTSPVNVFRLTAPWSENWGTIGTAFDPTTIHGSFTPAQDDAFVTVDLTALVQDWVCGTPNHGIIFMSTSDDLQSKYHSKEEDITSFRPTMDVQVGTGPGPCPANEPPVAA